MGEMLPRAEMDEINKRQDKRISEHEDMTTLTTKKYRTRRKKHFSDYIVAAAITAIALYTVAAVTLQFCGFMEISATLTTCWFSFWTVEIVSLAAIKGGKVKHGDKKTDKSNESEEN